MLSAGFDGHKDDPTKGMKLNPFDYHALTTHLMHVAGRHCQGKLVSVLEGGYDISPKTNSLAECITAHLQAILELDM